MKNLFVIFKYIALFYIIFILNINISLQSNDFVKLSNCSFYSSSNSLTYNLLPMRNNLVDYSIESQKYIFKSNLCGPLVGHCHGSIAPAALFLNKSYCIGKLSDSWESASVEFYDVNSKTKGIKILLPKGEKCYFGYNSYFQVSYSIICNSSLNESRLVNINKNNSCNYEYIFQSKYGCPVDNIVNDTSKSILNTIYNTPKNILMYLSLGLIVYIFVFGYLNYKQNPEDGIMKAFPHRNFWREYVENIRCGINICYNKAILIIKSLVQKKEYSLDY